jgi:hypothetical protein
VVLVRKKVATTNRVAQAEIAALDLPAEVIAAHVQVVIAAKADAPISAEAADAPSMDPSTSS